MHASRCWEGALATTPYCTCTEFKVPPPSPPPSNIPFTPLDLQPHQSPAQRFVPVAPPPTPTLSQPYLLRSAMAYSLKSRA
jgi:hypothetical protein